MAVSCSFFVFSVGINTSVIVPFPRARGHLYKVALFFASFCSACCHFPSLYLWCHCSSSFPSKITDIPLLLFSGAACLYAPCFFPKKQKARYVCKALFWTWTTYWVGFNDARFCCLECILQLALFSQSVKDIHSKREGKKRAHHCLKMFSINLSVFCS